jgi:Mg/Co/Ni transporter MgtE
MSRFKVDPATASAPLITSLADNFTIATWLLGL